MKQQDSEVGYVGRDVEQKEIVWNINFDGKSKKKKRSSSPSTKISGERVLDSLVQKQALQQEKVLEKDLEMETWMIMKLRLQ